MLEGLLTTEAASLYERLVREGGLRANGGDGESGDDTASPAAVAELDQLGLLYRSEAHHPDLLLPIPPITAFELLVMAKQREIAVQHAAIREAHEDVTELQRLFNRGQHAAGPSALAEIVTDRDAIVATASELQLAARDEVLTMNPLPYRTELTADWYEPPPAPALERGVRFRALYSRETMTSEAGLDIINRSRAAGEEARVVSRLPLKLSIADQDLALIPLESDPMGAVLRVRSPILVSALREMFELLWERAIPPVRGPEQTAHSAHSTNTLTPAQQRVLRLMATGLKDEAIGRATRTSVKTVRRHIATLLDLLGADTRFAAGVEAHRRGWLDAAE